MFPIDQNTIQRLAKSLSADELKQNRLTSIAAIMAMLEPLLKEIGRMEALATALESPHSPDLIKLIAGLRGDAERLYGALGGVVNWHGAPIATSSIQTPNQTNRSHP